MTLVGAHRLGRFGIAVVVASVVWGTVAETASAGWGFGVLAGLGLSGVGVVLTRRLARALPPDQLAAQQRAVAQDEQAHPDGLTADPRRSPLVFAAIGVVVVFGGLILLMLLLG